jgi:hypothetical protein
MVWDCVVEMNDWRVTNLALPRTLTRAPFRTTGVCGCRPFIGHLVRSKGRELLFNLRSLHEFSDSSTSRR